MPKLPYIELADEIRIPILYEDRSILAIDKPPGWMLVPASWERTDWNLQLAIDSSIRGGDYWARGRNLQYLRFLHRLDAETTGILLFAKSLGVHRPFTELFKSKRMEKVYLAVIHGRPKRDRWICDLPLSPEPDEDKRRRVDTEEGKEAETHFRVLAEMPGRTLIEARPLTGRTHQIRLHLNAGGYDIIGDELYGKWEKGRRSPMALRAVDLKYTDPFTRKKVWIRAPVEEFLQTFGFPPTAYQRGFPPRREDRPGQPPAKPQAPPPAAPGKTGPKPKPAASGRLHPEKPAGPREGKSHGG